VRTERFSDPQIGQDGYTGDGDDEEDTRGRASGYADQGNLASISNYKLRIESSRNEPQLRKLLGHISIYDSVREYRNEQLSQTTCPSVHPPCLDRRRQQQQRPTKPKPAPSTNELQEYLQLQQVRVPSFQDFQAAIELQLATLSEIQAASKKVHALSLDCPTIDAVADSDSTEVEEYCESDSDSDTISEYDSCDDDEDGESEDSMTDPESVRKEDPVDAVPITLVFVQTPNATPVSSIFIEVSGVICRRRI
jgi:hypothetical protein